MTNPFIPPIFYDAELPPLALVDELEAFEVHEVPAYTPSGEGTHHFVRIKKKGMTTRDAVRVVADAAGVSARDIGTAGQKDKYAVTTQWISVPEQGTPPPTWELPEDISVVEHTRHTNKLRTGHVAANQFVLTFEGDAEGALAPARDIMERIATRGLPNYYGRQRFGRGARNLEKALAWARGEFRLKGKDRRFKATLFASVLQSEVFNRYVSARVADPAVLLPGEVVRLDGSRSVFVVEDPEAEAPRVAEGDIHITGPMFGPKMRAPEGEAARLESEALAALELDDEAMTFIARNAPGTRRDVWVRPTGTSVEMASPERLVLAFTLPSGSYATQVAREFTRLSWRSPLRPQVDD